MGLKQSHLSDVKPPKNSWRVQTKILHTWKGHEGTLGESLEMVLADQKGTKIHASVKKSLVSRHQRHLAQVGSHREFYSGSSEGAVSAYRVTFHPFKINFLNGTTVTPSNVVSEDVYLSLMDFPTIIIGELNPFVMIDVLGQIVHVGAIKDVEAHNKPTKRLEFELRNTEDVNNSLCKILR